MAKCICETLESIPTELDGAEIHIGKWIPFPLINLTTGEEETPAGKEFYALFIDTGIDTDFVPISYCFKCGRKLESHDKTERGYHDENI